MDKLKRRVSRVIGTYLVQLDPQPGDTLDAIYIMGGAPPSLWRHFLAASEMYRVNGIRSSILVLGHGDEIMGYNVKLGRTLTRDEWAIENLTRMGVPRSLVEIVDVKSGFFGTLSEARTLSKLFRERQYRRVAIVSSPYHSRRVRLCFSSYLRNSEVEVHYVGSDGTFLLRNSMTELFKVVVYRIMLLSR